MTEDQHYLGQLLSKIHVDYGITEAISKSEYVCAIQEFKKQNITGKEALFCYENNNFTIHDFQLQLLQDPLNLSLYIFKAICMHCNSKTVAGCYRIVNKETGEMYVGETVDMFTRFSQHISMLYNGTHHCAALQEAFNKHKDIDRFTFQPIFFFETSYYKGRVAAKTRTLYLEAVYYLIYRYKKIPLYNTINPFLELKNNEKKTFDNYEIIYKDVLQMIYDDPDKILTKDLKEKIRRILNEKGIFETQTESPKKKHSTNKQKKKIGYSEVDTENGVYKYKDKTYPLCSGEKYTFTDLNRLFSDEGILPIREELDYLLFKKTLVHENLLDIDDGNKLFAKDSSLIDGYLELKHFKTSNSDLYKYQITEKGKDKIIEIINRYGKDYFRMQN